MIDARLDSPLAHREAIKTPDAAALLAERTHLGKIILRGDAEIAAPAIKKIAGKELPVTPNTSSRSKSATILWLGPDEWLLLTQPGKEDALQDKLSKALSGTHHQIVNVTDQHTVITLSGDKAREMLMKLTTLDLHPSQFKPGNVAGSMFGNTVATLHMTSGDKKGEAPSFDLIVRRSFADYLWCALADAGREFGLPEQEPRMGEAMRP